MRVDSNLYEVFAKKYYCENGDVNKVANIR